MIFRSALRYSEVQAGRRPPRRRARDACRSTSRRANISWSASTWSRRASARLQLAFDQLKKRLQAEGLFDRPASGRCLPCPARSASSRRSTAPPSATSSRCSPALCQRAPGHPARRACRARARRAKLRAALRAIGRVPGRRRRHRRPRRRLDRGPLGVQRGGRRARHRASRPCRSFRRSATRRT